ncbi:hypothetical protein SFRURICE_020675 [Spodoptera frugiperda]|nr:hypothetical protein SFRURICE_020675 [Spodoptera frugiperda]
MEAVSVIDVLYVYEYLHINFQASKQRHAFYPRRGRQRCTLRHVMPLYMYTHFSPIVLLVPCNRGNTLPDTGIESETTRPTRQSNILNRKQGEYVNLPTNFSNK